MKVTALQLQTRWHDVQANIAAADRLMNLASGSDVYVLPEMWAWGFDLAPDEQTQAAAEATLAWMRRQAAERDCAVAGTIPEKDEPTGSWRNRFHFVTPDGADCFYDKRNLFGYGGEEEHYAPGSERVVANYKGVRFMLQTCFDLRFPETGRNFLAEPYDVVLYAANWPAARRTAWDALLAARAIENQAYCLGVNRVGTDCNGDYNGGSAAIDLYGKVLFRLDEHEQAATFEPDLKRLQHFREKFPVLR